MSLLYEALVDNPEWRNYVAVDTDTDHNGDISEREVEEKFKTYIDVVFTILDNNTDGRLTQLEAESPRLSLAQVRRLIHQNVIFSILLRTGPTTLGHRRGKLPSQDLVQRGRCQRQRPD